MFHENLVVNIYKPDDSFFQRIDDFSDLQYTTLIPGGFGTLSFEVNRIITREWREFRHFLFIKVYLQLDVVWEGRIENVSRQLQQQGEIITINAYGFMRNLYDDIYNWIWADTRWTAWSQLHNIEYYGSLHIPESFGYNETSRLRVIVKRGENYPLYRWGGYLYDMPFGAKVRRIKGNWALTIATGTWRIAIVDKVNGGTTYWEQTEAGSGTFDVNTTATYPNGVRFILQAMAANGIYDSDTETTYGQLTDLTVFSTTGTVYADDIIKHALTNKCSQISSDQSNVDSPGKTLSPAILEEDRVVYDTIKFCEQFDDSTNDGYQWYFAVWEDRKPYFKKKISNELDYFLNIRDCQIKTTREGQDMWNSVFVSYIDNDGKRAETSTNTDTDSIDYYELTRNKGIPLGTNMSSATAQRVRDIFLETHKEPIQKSSLTTQGPVYRLDGRQIPLAKVRAGKSILMRGLGDKLDQNTFEHNLDNKQIFYIMRTSYNYDNNTLEIFPDNPLPTIETILARQRKLRQYA